MNLVVSDKSKTLDVVKRAFFLAYNACGRTFGMGILQAKDNATEEDVWNNIQNQGDYPGRINIYPKPKHNAPSADYVFGRMMKLSCEFNEDDGIIKIHDSEPIFDYQGWSGKKFPTYKSLFECAAAEIGVSLSLA